MKLIAITLLMMLILAVGASALSLPMIISGKVKNEAAISGLKVTLTNIRTSGQAIVYTDSVGYFQFEPQNMDFGALGGDNFIVECQGKSIEVNNLQSVPISIVIDLRGQAICPSCPDPDVCPQDITPYAECDSCCPEQECPEPEPCEPEPCDENRALEVLLAALAGAGVAGSAVTLTLSSKSQHYHRGIKNKHSIYTIHRDSEIRHRFGEIAPVYIKNSSGKYVYRGSS